MQQDTGASQLDDTVINCPYHSLPKPEYCTPLIYDVMLKCWEYIPAERPNFVELSVMLQDIIAANPGGPDVDTDGYVQEQMPTKIGGVGSSILDEAGYVADTAVSTMVNGSEPLLDSNGYVEDGPAQSLMQQAMADQGPAPPLQPRLRSAPAPGSSGPRPPYLSIVAKPLPPGVQPPGFRPLGPGMRPAAPLGMRPMRPMRPAMQPGMRPPLGQALPGLRPLAPGAMPPGFRPMGAARPGIRPLPPGVVPTGFRPMGPRLGAPGPRPAWGAQVRPNLYVDEFKALPQKSSQSQA